MFLTRNFRFQLKSHFAERGCKCSGDQSQRHPQGHIGRKRKLQPFPFYLLTQSCCFFFPRRLSSLERSWDWSPAPGCFRVMVCLLGWTLMCSGMDPKTVFILTVYAPKSSRLFWFWSFSPLRFFKCHSGGDTLPSSFLGSHSPDIRKRNCGEKTPTIT